MGRFLILGLLLFMTGPAMSQTYCVDEQQRAYQADGFSCTNIGKAVCSPDGSWVVKGKCNPNDAVRGAGIVGTMRNGVLVRPNPNERIPLDPVTPNTPQFGVLGSGHQALDNFGTIYTGAPSEVGPGIKVMCRTAGGTCTVKRIGPCHCRTGDGKMTYVGEAK